MGGGGGRRPPVVVEVSMMAVILGVGFTIGGLWALVDCDDGVLGPTN